MPEPDEPDDAPDPLLAELAAAHEKERLAEKLAPSNWPAIRGVVRLLARDEHKEALKWDSALGSAVAALWFLEKHPECNAVLAFLREGRLRSAARRQRCWYDHENGRWRDRDPDERLRELSPRFWRMIPPARINWTLNEVALAGADDRSPRLVDVRVEHCAKDEKSRLLTGAAALAYLDEQSRKQQECAALPEPAPTTTEAGNHVESGDGRPAAPKNNGGRPAYEFWPRAQNMLKTWGIGQAKKKCALPIQARFEDHLANIIGPMNKPKGVDPSDSVIRRYAKAVREEVKKEFEGL
jgi:hypothetical protein